VAATGDCARFEPSTTATSSTAAAARRPGSAQGERPRG
jgi:hypothetical protein